MCDRREVQGYLRPLEKPKPGPTAAGLAKHRHWERPQYSAFSSSWLGLGRLLPGMEPGGEGPSLKLLGRS